MNVRTYTKLGFNLLLLLLATTLIMPGKLLAQSTVVATIPVGNNPDKIDITPDGSKAYVANGGSNTVSVIDTVSNLVTTTIPIGNNPKGIRVHPNGSEVWVSNRLAGTVNVIRVADDTVVATINPGTGLVDEVTFTPNGNQAYVVSDETSGANVLNIIDVATRTVVDTIVTALPQEGITFSPDGILGYLLLVEQPAPNKVTSTGVLDVATKTIIDTIPNVWIRTVASDGQSGWAINSDTNTVSLVDLTTRSILTSISVLPNPHGVALTPDNGRLFVANHLSNKVTVIDTITNTVLETILVGNGPVGLDITPDGSRVYVTNFLDTVVSVIAASVTPYHFTGFFQPVDNLPVLNQVNAGRAIPVKFSLGGDQGLDIFAAGYPKSQEIPCDSAALVDGIEQTVTAGSSSLSYDPTTDQYNYVWKTEKAWANTCRQLVVKLNDDSVHRANFKFK